MSESKVLSSIADARRSTTDLRKSPEMMASLDEAALRSFGERWIGRHRAFINSLPNGTVLAVDMTSEECVSAASGLEAMDKFEAAFGGEAVAWVHEVGIPISLGGGLWQLRSGT